MLLKPMLLHLVEVYFTNSDLGKGLNLLVSLQITNTENCIVRVVNTYYAILLNIISIYRNSDLNKNNIEKNKIQIENIVYHIINFEDFTLKNK